MSLLAALCSLLAACGSGGSETNPRAASGDRQQADSTSAQLVMLRLVDPATLPEVKRIYFRDIFGVVSFLCTGTMINQFDLLTAAHCVTQRGTPILHSPEKLLVELAPGQLVPAVELFAHPLYTGGVSASSVYSGTGYIPGDIGVIRLSTPTEIFAPILPEVPALGTQILIAGFGATASGLGTDELLRAGFTQIDALSLVEGAFYWFFDSVTEANTCFGDSGGPAFVIAASGVRSLVGVTSAGAPNCELGSSSVDTLIISYLPWLTEVTAGAVTLQ